MRVLFVCADKAIASSAIQILRDAGVEAIAVGTSEVPEQLRDVDAVLFWHQDWRRMSRTRRLKLLRLSSRVPVIDVMKIEDVLTMTESALFADGIVFLDANLDRLVEIVHLTKAGYILLPRDLTAERLRSSAETNPVADLSELDLEVLAGLAEGLSDREIAGRLHVSEPTAKRFVHRLMRKLCVENRTRAAVYVRLFARLREALEHKD